MAVTIGLAVLRYRLFDIDLIIRRTLLYSMLTGALALVYFGLVTLLQNFFTEITGQQSPLAVVISTLAIAALFNPLRLRFQALIDRRFYRSRYEAERALAQFSAAARSTMDVHQLTDQLTQIVQGTMQPQSVTLWLAASEEQDTAHKTYPRGRNL
jgi:hypothetical protein